MNPIQKQSEFRIPQRLQGIEKSMIRQIADRALPDSINFGLGEPDLQTPDCVRNEAIRVIQEEQNGYTLQAGIPKLREKIITEYPHLNLKIDDIVVTVGSSEALYASLMTLAEEGDEVLVPDPSFPAYWGIIKMTGAKMTKYRLPAEKGFAFDIEEFKKQITDKTRVVMILSPSNPTGRVHTREELQQIAEVLQGTGIYVISDEIYRDVYFTDEPPASISEYYDKTLIVGGLSKAMSMTGWRLGWLTGEPIAMKSAFVLHGYNVTCTSAVSQKAALKAWTDEGQAARQYSREVYKNRREHILKEIETQLGLPAISPEGAFYTMLDVRSICDDEMEICEKFLQNRVITIAGKAFGDETKGFLRLSFCCDETKITEGIRRMKEALEK
ncbi:MAG TPA: aminotransferase class I/II-fold pyridoxal phosphate-dependent enzyme [Pyrinomonadaceae bacterium]|nr:aminotransferase class I/II-fold pyridoxal phosphate-dependent enzyme [Pyrinomonadaceae bacterium]